MKQEPALPISCTCQQLIQQWSGFEHLKLLELDYERLCQLRENVGDKFTTYMYTGR
jgi:hypothetical protein